MFNIYRESKSLESLQTLLVDDNKLFIDTAERFITANSNIDILGYAFNGKEAINKVTQLKPDLVLMDISMPVLGGLKATKIIKKLNNPPHIIITTLHDTVEYRTEAKEAGADGFLFKFNINDELFPLVELLFKVDK